MKDNSKTIRAETRVKAGLAFAGWLFLLVLPLLLLNSTFESYLFFLRNRNLVAKKPLLNDEIYQFFEDLSAQNWLQEKVDQFNENNGFREFSAEELLPASKYYARENAASFAQKLENHLQTKVAALFYYGPDTKTVDVAIADDSSFSFRKPPLVFVKRICKILSRQKESELLSQYDSMNQNSAKIVRVSKKEEQTNDSLLRTIFGNICEISLEPAKVVKTISSKLGDTGPVFFIFSPARIKKGRRLYNLGGYIAVVRLQDIAPEKVFSSAVANNSSPEINRRIFLSNFKLEFPDRLADGGCSGYVEDESGLHLRSVLPETAIVHLLQRGTIVPGDLQKFTEHLPMIEVFISTAHLTGALGKYGRIIKSILVFLFVLGTLFFLRLSLFGMNFKLSVSVKILVSLSFISVIPFMILGLAYVSFIEFEGNNIKELARKVLAQKISNLQNQVKGAVNKVEQQNIKFAIKLEAEKNLSRDALAKHIGELIDSGFAESVLENDLQAGESFYVSDAIAEENMPSRAELQGFSFFGRNLAEFLRNSPHIPGEAGGISKLLNDQVSNADSLSKILKNEGKLLTLPRMNKDYWLSSLLISEEDVNGKNIPRRHLLLSFPQNILLTTIFNQIAEEISLSENTGGYQIDTAVALREGNALMVLPKFSSEHLSRPEIKRKMELSNFLRRNLFWEGFKDGKSFIEIAGYDESLPYICFAKTEWQDDRSEFLFSHEFYQALLYLALLALMIVVLSRQLFVKPVLYIVQGLMEISRGNLKYKFNLFSGDEFQSLASSLNSMVRGLIEKDILAEFVSEDVKHDVSQAVAGEFKPGGELIDATIVFCEPIGFAEFLENNSSEQVIQLLNHYVAETSQICSQQRGAIDKIIENTLMIVFRSEEGHEHHSLRAAKASLMIGKCFNLENGEFPFSCKIGISTGKVISGKIGSNVGKLDFTVIGDTVNMAARLKAGASIAKETGILVSSTTAEILRGKADLKEKQQLEIKGKAGMHRVYELITIR